MIQTYHTRDGYVNVTVYSSTGEVYVYAEATLLPLFYSHVKPQCIVGVGVAEHSHLLQDNSNVLSRERERGKRGGRQNREKERRLNFIQVRTEKN